MWASTLEAPPAAKFVLVTVAIRLGIGGPMVQLMSSGRTTSLT